LRRIGSELFVCGFSFCLSNLVLRAIDGRSGYFATTFALAVGGAIKLSWEKVDDLENLPSALTAEVPKGLDQECDVLTDEQKCREFEYAMKKLDELAQGAQTINYQIKYHTEKLQNLKLDGASNRQSKSRRKISTSAINSAQYKVAKAEAEAANKEFGADSPQAKVAWSEVYEIVASEGRNERVSKVALEEECIIDDTSAACRDYAAKMKDLQKALNSPANSD
jgi:hypothetical protein